VGRGHGLLRRLAIFADPDWTEWLPSFAWVIDHPEGIIVVDTGQGAHLRDSGKLLHPYLRWEAAFRIEPEEEIGPQLRALGIGPRDVKRVILTHMHVDHDGGLAHFPRAEIHVPRGEIRMASGRLGLMRGYLPSRWPSWFEPVPLDLPQEPFGPFTACKRLTGTGDVVAVATPGHTADHISVLIMVKDTTIMLAGDSSYDDRLLLDGVAANDHVATATLDAIKRLARSGPLVYLPTHDPQSAARLTGWRTLSVGKSETDGKLALYEGA
jgi:N-acyl homoserine lactone hydrolase